MEQPWKARRHRNSLTGQHEELAVLLHIASRRLKSVVTSEMEQSLGRTLTSSAPWQAARTEGQ